MEILLATLQKLSYLAFGLAIALAISSVSYFLDLQLDPKDQSARKRLKHSSIACVMCACIACIPNVNDIWRVRIGLIKLSLASPENITKTSETIERIGRKLECKYLGCDEQAGK